MHSAAFTKRLVAGIPALSCPSPLALDLALLHLCPLPPAPVVPHLHPVPHSPSPSPSGSPLTAGQVTAPEDYARSTLHSRIYSELRDLIDQHAYLQVGG